MTEFEALLQAHFVPLQRYIRYKIANLHDAEDIMQEVCMTASEKFPTLKDRAAFKAWLIGIAGHKCMDYYRRKAHLMEIPLDALSESSFRVGRCGITEQSAVRETLDALGDREKQILYLYYFRDLSQGDIANRLNIPIGTVKSRLHYAKEKFKEQYPYKPRTEGEINMKTFNIKLFNINENNIDKFFELMNGCKGKVELVSEGFRVDLRSRFAQYVSIAKIFMNKEVSQDIIIILKKN